MRSNIVRICHRSKHKQRRARALTLTLAAGLLLGFDCASAATSTDSDRWIPACPTGFEPQVGLNSGFLSDDAPRQFHVLLPDELSTPRPVFVALTGTVQPELSFLKQSGLDQLPNSGWIVIAPVRTCATQGKNCNGIGTEGDGRNWEPWFDGHPDPNHDQGPDVRFVEAAVKCAATKWSVDQSRVYIGGISAGGTFTNRALTYRSDFFAGGVPASGVWYPVDRKGGSIDGMCCKRPLPTMDASIVITIWGGPNDKWPLDRDPPLANYAPETKISSRYFGSQPAVVHLACSGAHGHIWPVQMTQWLASTLLLHPKGSDPGAFKMTEPPSGFSCVRGVYTDH